jgi:hypothetical protein
MNVMESIRVNAERLAWTDEIVNREAAKHAPDLSRTDRAVLLMRARAMKRRAIRVSRYLNERACACGGWTVAIGQGGVPYRFCARSGAHVRTAEHFTAWNCPYARRAWAMKT